MGYCMESLGSAKKIMDKEYEFYDIILKTYVPFINDGKILKMNDYHQKLLSGAWQCYDDEYGTEVANLSLEAKLGDSLLFFIATGVIILANDKFMINTSELQKTFLRYEDIKLKVQDDEEEKGQVKKIGTMKN